jgi:outer membrane protein assembly factor BamB
MANAGDWPTYLHDVTRGGVTDESLSLPLQPSWVRDAPSAIQRAWSEPEGRTVEGKDLYDRLRFDDAFQVAVVGDKLYYGSSVDHKIYCLETDSGAEQWSFYTGAAVRLAPTIAEGRVYAGSDDGYAYCLDAGNGQLIWKYRLGPSDEWFLGRGEMISRWPVRTGILVADGIAYFAAGIFPHENVYMCAVDAADGKVLWRNDNISHQEAGREDLSPQGYLLASPEHVYVPSGRSRPKSFDRRTGKLLGSVMSDLGISSGTIAGTNAIMIDGRLHLYSPGSHIAGTGAASFVTTGSYLVRMDSKSYGPLNDAVKNLRDEQRTLYRNRSSLGEEEYEKESARLAREIQTLDDKSVAWRAPCSANASLIVVGDHAFAGGANEVVAFETSTGKQVWNAEIDGDARGLAAADGRLFVSTSRGRIYAFGSARGAVTSSDRPNVDADPYPADAWTDKYRVAAAEMLKRSGVNRGYCLVLGSEQGRLAYELARQSDLKIYGVERDAEKVSVARKALSKAGLYGHRVTIHHVDDDVLPYSNYFANLIVSDRLLLTGQLPASGESVAGYLKPAGGVVCLGQPDPTASANASLATWLIGTQLVDQSEIKQDPTWATLTRGTLPGAGNWSHQYAEPGNTANSGDKVVQGGLGVLWYGDPGPDLMVNRHQGAVGPLVVDGRMFIQGESSLMAYDVYNGLFLWEVENSEATRTGVFQNRSPGNLAAGNDLLFHMVRERVYAHDVATGEVRAIYSLPDSVDPETKQWGYIGYRDGRLIGTATTRETIARRFRRRGNPGAAATDAVFAIDTETGEHLWVYQGKSIDFQTIALGPDRVFFIDSSVTSEQRADILRQDKSELKQLTGEAAKRAEERMKDLDVRLAVAIDAAVGDVLWKNPVDVTDCSDIGIGGGKLTLIYQDDTLLLCGANANGHYWNQFIAGEFERRRLVALSATVGYKLWSKDANYRHRPIIIGSRVIAEPWGFDLRTGEQEMREHPLTGAEVPWSIARPGHHCGMLTGSDNMLVFRSGFTGFYDLSTDSGTRHFAGHRLGCWINAIPTNGLVVMPEASAGCVCMFSIASTIVMEPREPRRPWSLFSQTGPSTPVRQVALNLGAPGDRRDQTGQLWLSWPRPSDNPRSNSTDKTGLALEFDIETTFRSGGGFVSHDGDATVGVSPELAWVTSSGGRGLVRLSVPLLGAEDPPGTYTVRLHLAQDSENASSSSACDVLLQGEPVLKDLDLSTESEGRIVREFAGIEVVNRLVVELASQDGTETAVIPLVCAVEVVRTDGE